MTASQSPASPQKFVRCPGCSERLGVRAEDAGRKARCAKCGRVFVIGGDGASNDSLPAAAGETSSPSPTPPPEKAAPALVTFSCSLCETRITVRVADVGKKVACPDCGRRNVIPVPPKPKSIPAPAAMSGEQIGLWSVDDKTWEPGFATAAARHPVECRLCQTLMYATDDQLGHKVKCPDCGAMTIAQRSAPKPPPGVLALATGPSYELDPASAPEPRPVVMPIAIRDAQLHEHARATTVGPDGRLIVQKDERHERPVRPAVPLIQGVWRMLVTEEVLARWIMTSLLFGGAAWFIFDALSTPMQSAASIMAIFMMIMGVGLLVLWLTFAAPTFLAVVAESSEGHDRLHEAPQWSPLEWFGETMYLVNALALAGMPGMVAWALGAPLPPLVLGLMTLGLAVAIFPVAYLGALLENSAFGVISPRLLSTLVLRPGPWLLFYIELALLAAATVAICLGLLLAGTTGLFLMPLAIMGAAFTLMRLLGRLAWWLGDLMPAPDEEEEVDDAAAAHPHLAAARAAARAEAQAK